MDGLILRRGFRQLPAGLVHPAVAERAVHGVGAGREFRLHPFQVGQPWAVDVFVEEADREQEVGVGGRIGHGDLGVAFGGRFSWA